jgi:hypothetical protein
MLEAERDEVLGEALCCLDTPAHREDFMWGLQAALDAEQRPASTDRAGFVRQPALLRLLAWRRFRLLVGVGVALVGGLIGGVLLLTGSTRESTAMSGDDLATVGRLAVAYVDAQSIAVTVPGDALAHVKNRQAVVVASAARPVQDGQPHAAVLSAAAKHEIDVAYRAAMSKVLTPAFLAKKVDRPAAAGQDAGTMLDEGLYDNPKQAPVVGGKSALAGYLKCKGQIGKDFIVWAQIWSEDVTQYGPRIEAWPVYEFRVVKTPLGWRVADARVIWLCLDRDHSEWGPSSPHDSLQQGEPAAPSMLYETQVSSGDF